jgi:predicted O-linked N-acetylglucosamine transferase (SPINDLY family)
MGLGELVTASLEDYEAMARVLACDAARLASLRARLAENRLASPLFNVDRFRQDIEAAYARMMEISRAGRTPESFAVPA